MKFSIAGSFHIGPAGARCVRAGWRSPDGIRFQKQAPYGSLLRQAYRGRVGNSSTCTPDGVQVVRPGAVGLLNLKSFLRVVPQADRKSPTQDAESKSQGEFKGPPPDSPPRRLSPVPEHKAPSREERMDTMLSLADDLRLTHRGEAHDGWAEVHAQTLAASPSLVHLHHAALTRGRCAQAVRDMGMQLRQQVSEGKSWDEAGVAQLRLNHAREALRLALPGLSRNPPVSGMNEPVDAWIQADDHGQKTLLQETLQALIQVSDRMTAAGVTDFDIDRLAAALSHGSIREASDRPSCVEGPASLRQSTQGRNEAPKMQALRSLQGLARLMLDATAPGCDGSALNGLLGRSIEFDAALRALRIHATTRCLLEAAEHKGPERKLPEAGLQADDKAARSDATALVDREIDIARARCRLMRAFDLAGVARPVNTLASIRLSDGTLSALRRRIGVQRASEVGLALAALRLMDKALSESAQAGRLRAALRQGPESGAAADRLEPLDRARNVSVTLERLVEIEHKTERQPRREPGGVGRDLKHPRPPEWQPDFSSMEPSCWEGQDASPREYRKVARPQTGSGAPDDDRESLGPLGLSCAEADALGLDGETGLSGDAQRIISLARQGFSSAHAAREAITAIDDIIDRVLGDMTPERLADERRTYLQGARDDDAARQLGDLLLRNLTNDMSQSLAAAKGERQAPLREAMRRTLAPLASLAALSPAAGAQRSPLALNDEPREEPLQRQPQRDEDDVGEAGMPLIPRAPEGKSAKPWRQRLPEAGGTAKSHLRDLGHKHAAAKDRLVNLSQSLASLRERAAQCEEAVAAYGARIDPRHASCRAACQVLDRLLVEYGNNPDDRVPAGFSAAAAALRGFDPTLLRTARVLGRPLTWSRFQAMARDPDLVAAVGAVARLAQADEDIEYRQGEVVALVADMDEVLGRRRAQLKLMGNMAEPLDGAIRAAILLHRDSKTSVLQYRPADHADRIKATLREWGVPVDQLLPEIDTVLSESFGPDELNLWREQLYLSKAYRLNQQAWLRQHQNALTSHPSSVPASGVAVASDKTRVALQEAVDRLQTGARTKLQVGWKVEGQSGGLMLAPGVGLNGKLAHGRAAILEIGSTPEGYDLSLRASEDWKLGLDTVVGPSALPLLQLAEDAGVAAGITVPAEIGRAKASGFVLRFPPGESGRQAMKAVLDALVTRGGFARNASGVEHIAPLMEVKYAGKVGVSFKLGWGSLEIPSKVADKYVDGFFGARAGASAGGQRLTSQETNVNYSVRKTEREVNLELSVAAGASAVVGLPRVGGDALYREEDDDKHKTGTELLDVAGTWTGMYKRKTKEMRDLYGQVQKGTEWQQQLAVPGRLRRAAVEKMVGPQFAALMQDLRASPVEAHRKTADDIDNLIGAAGTNDVISIASTLDDRVREQVNELLAQASACRASVPGNAGRGLLQGPPAPLLRAQALEKQAQALLDSPLSYVVARVTLLATRESVSALPVLNGLWVKGSRQVEDKGEFITSEIKPDPVIARAAHDRALELPTG